MHIAFTIPFWGLIIAIILVGFFICWIISLFADDSGYGGDIFNTLLILLVALIVIFVCIGMIIGNYLF